MKTETIHVSQQDVNGKKEWRMAVGATEPPKGPGKYGKLKVPKEDYGEFTFKIQGSDANFHPTRPIEITVVEGSPSPGDPGQFTWDLKTPKKLQLEDPNRDPQPTDYYYKLNFDDGTSLDPIIQNGCCRPVGAVGGSGGGFALSAEAGVIAVGLAAAAAIAFVVARSRRTRS